MAKQKPLRAMTIVLSVCSSLIFAVVRAEAHEGGLTSTAELESKSGSGVVGSLRLQQHGNAVHVSGAVKGLTPGFHGVHVHANGNCDSADGLSAGHVFNPTGARRQGGRAGEHPLGDLGNILADEAGNVEIELVVDGATIALMGTNSIAERAIVIFDVPDDHSDPDGNGGRRVACGFIDQDMMRM